MKKWVTSVEVKDFRGIREVKLGEGEVGRVNIIVGRSNSCKSALLEAIALATSFPYFTDAVGALLPAWAVVRRGRPYSARALVRFGTTESYIEAKFVSGNRVGLLLLTDDSNSLDKYWDVVGGLAERIGSRIDVVYGASSNGDKDAGFVLAVAGGEVVAEVSESGRAGVAFVDPHMEVDALARTIDELIVRGVLPEEVIKEYRHAIGKYNRVEDIRIGYNGAVYVKLEGMQYVPYNALGLGLRLSLFYTLVEKLVQGGIVLIDSPDALHPSLAYHLATRFTWLDNQYFIVTNSVDLLNSTIELMEDANKLEELRIIRMSDCELVDTLGGEETRIKSVEIGQDLREV